MRYLVLLILCLILRVPSYSQGQCTDKFSYSVISSDRKKNNGKIEISIEGPHQDYTLKVYSIIGEIKLVKTESMLSSDQMISIEGLEPSDYLVKLEGVAGCTKTIGGIEGIHLIEKAG